MSVTCTLPFPLSVNRMYRSVAGRSILSEEYRSWKSEAGLSLRFEQKVPSISGPVEITVELVPPDRRHRDADNTLKSCLDALVAGRVIEGDHNQIVREIHVYWRESGPPCQVTIEPVSTAHEAGRAA